MGCSCAADIAAVASRERLIETSLVIQIFFQLGERFRTVQR